MAGTSPAMTLSLFTHREATAKRLVALRALHAFADPLLGVDAYGRVHALGRIAHDVIDLRLLGLLVEAIGAVGGLGDALVAVAERPLHVAGGAVILDALERGGDLVGGRLVAVLLGCFVGELQAEQRLHHLIGRIGRRDVVAVAGGVL